MTPRDHTLATWGAAIDEFPLSGSKSEKLKALIQYAVQAPSSHNSQPWLFRVVDDVLELRADRQRRLPIVDPADRELTISCGAALGNIEVALHNFGFDGDITLLPEGTDAELLARVRLGDAREPTLLDRALFSAIPLRRTHRLPFLKRTPSPDLIAALESIGNQHDVRLRILSTESNQKALADLISQGDRAQMADEQFRKELVAWLNPNRSRSRDGMPGWTYGLGPITSIAIPLIVRTFDTGSGRAAIDMELAYGSPILAVLLTPADTPLDWMHTGRVLMQVLLRAGIEGVAASYLNQPIELPELRRKVSVMLGDSGYPQLILRMGFPVGEDRRTPRREVRDVLEVIS